MRTSADFTRVVALVGSAIASFAANAKCEIKAFPIPVTMVGTRAVAHVRLNDKETPFTLDTGAFFSTMTEATAEQLELKTHATRLDAWGIAGPIDYRVTKVDRVGLQGAELRGVEFLVGGNEVGAGTVGLLGRNLLGTGDAEYDLANGVVRLMFPNGDCKLSDLAYWAGSTPVVDVPLLAGTREKAPALKTKASIDGTSVTVLLDSGATSLLSLGAAKHAGLVEDESKLKRSGTVWGAGRGERPSWTVPMERFEIGGERIGGSRIEVADTARSSDSDMLLGIDFFLSHRIYVARSQGRILFTYGGGPVFDLSLKTVGPAAEPSGPDEVTKDAAELARRGAASAARGERQRAMDDLNRAVELAPEIAAYRMQRARVELAQKLRREALADLDEALRLDPSDDEALLLRAQQRTAAGDPGGARGDLQTLDGRIAAQSNLRRAMGGVYASLGEPMEAIAQFDRWLASHAVEQDRYQVLNSRCWARALAATQLEEALSDCNAALKAQPSKANFLDSRGLVHLRLGQPEKAVADYDEALKQNPTIGWSLWGRGLARMQLGMREPAMDDFLNARRQKPDILDQARKYGLDLPPGVALPAKTAAAPAAAEKREPQREDVDAD